MKHLISLLVMVVVAWPTILIGYIYGALETGFIAGRYLFLNHAEEASSAIDKLKKKHETH